MKIRCLDAEDVKTLQSFQQKLTTANQVISKHKEIWGKTWASYENSLLDDQRTIATAQIEVNNKPLGWPTVKEAPLEKHYGCNLQRISNLKVDIDSDLSQLLATLQLLETMCRTIAVKINNSQKDSFQTKDYALTLLASLLEKSETIRCNMHDFNELVDEQFSQVESRYRANNQTKVHAEPLEVIAEVQEKLTADMVEIEQYFLSLRIGSKSPEAIPDTEEEETTDAMKGITFFCPTVN